MRNISKSAFPILSMFFIFLFFFLKKRSSINHKIDEFESLHVEMYHYVLGNRGIIFPLTLAVHVLLIVISPYNVL